MGTPSYAKEILEVLLGAEDIDVNLVITQPDRPVGRKNILTPPPVKILAQMHNIRVLQPEKLTDEGIVEAIKASHPDFIVVAAFGQLLQKAILDIAPCINLHASLLPEYRGASPVQQSLLNGDAYTGVTAMLMEEGLDSGPILGYYYFKIPDKMRLHALMAKLSQDACRLTLDILRNFEEIAPQKQIKTHASYCKKIKKSDGEVAFDDARRLYNAYRAFEGWPGIFISSGTKLLEIELIESDLKHEAGKVTHIGEDSIIVGCLKGSLKLITLQPVSKKPMDAKSYCVGRGIKVGDIFV
ncbi:MAG: methionyl-tRNA formyltransferase [Campylobacterota bacterium]|nr:methionyl-tRNA formyltransferase [Campylobacterota bacterium]